LLEDLEMASTSSVEFLVPLVIKGIFALMLLGGLAALTVVAIVAIIKGRPGIAAFVGGIVFLGLLIPAGLVFSWVSVRSSDSLVHVGHPVNSAMQFSPRISLVGIAILVCAFAAVFALLSRRPSSSAEPVRRRTWWPALLLLPLVFFWFIGTVRVQKSRDFSFQAEVAPPPMATIVTVHPEEQELVQRMADIRERIEKMEIHELMDCFDAPRIVLSAPSPAAIPWLALAPLAATKDVQDAQLDAEAAAAVKLLSGGEPVAESNDEEKIEQPADAAAVAAVAASNDEQAEAEAEVEQRAATSAASTATAPIEAEEALSTPIGGEASRPKIDPNRPDWVKNRPKSVGHVQKAVLATDEWSTEEECKRARDVALMLKTYEHIQQLVGAPYENHSSLELRTIPGAAWIRDHRLHQLHSAGITLDYVRREIAREEYLETTERSVGPMMKLYTLLEFTPAVDRELRAVWDAYQRRERFAVVGVGAGGILGLLGFTYGLLKLDTWTKGYYSKRLFLGVPALIGLVTLLLAMAVFG
jgi:hypothetical protein